MEIFGHDEPFCFSGDAALVLSEPSIFGGASAKGLGRAGLAVVGLNEGRGRSVSKLAEFLARKQANHGFQCNSTSPDWEERQHLEIIYEQNFIPITL